MSYDLQVFSEQCLDIDDLQRLLESAGLKAGKTGDGTCLVVARGAREHYSFTLGLPVRVEAEDVPEEVTAALLAPSYMYELLVEGSSATETPHATRFARRLARASRGVVLDQQTGLLWAAGKARVVPPIQRGTIAIVDLHWYVRPEGAGAAAARTWLALARRHLPEALPRRFGPVEPLSMKLDVDGSDAFVDSVAAEAAAGPRGSSIYFRATAPCAGGSLASGGREGISSHGMSVHRGALEDARWRAALQRLFVEFALATNSVFASAEVVRGLEWSGRGIWYGGTAEKTTYLAGSGQWVGLLPYPAWWSWFGPEYVPLVVNHLPPQQMVHADGGLFHARSQEPLDRDQLAVLGGPANAATSRPRALHNLFSRRTSRRTARSWLPEDLLPTVDHSDPSRYVQLLTPAVMMPERLRN